MSNNELRIQFEALQKEYNELCKIQSWTSERYPNFKGSKLDKNFEKKKAKLTWKMQKINSKRVGII